MDLDIYLHGRHVGHTEPMSRGRKLRIVYEDATTEAYPVETPLLSCSLPVGYPSEPGAARSFLEGLLPEGRALESMAARLSEVSLDPTGAANGPYDAAGLLGEYGRECAGAVALVPRGAPAPGQGATYQDLNSGDVANLLRDLPSKPLGVDVSRDIRMSLAGAQPKLLLALLNEQWRDPTAGAASTHILKPTGRWPLSADNECIVMTLAARVGLTASPVWVESFAGRRTLVVQRFDRRITDDRVDRLHQEDLCQAVKLRPKDKYLVGHLSGRPLDIIQERSADPRKDMRNLFRQLTFRAIVGDEDGHAKNYGLMLADGRVGLAPIYDCLTTLAYTDLAGRMAAPIGRQTYLAKVDRAALMDEGRAFRFTEQETRELVESLAVSIRDEIDRLNPDLAEDRAMAAVTGIVRSRVLRLLEGAPMGEPDATLRLDRTTGTRSGENLDQATLADPR